MATEKVYDLQKDDYVEVATLEKEVETAVETEEETKEEEEESEEEVKDDKKESDSEEEEEEEEITDKSKDAPEKKEGDEKKEEEEPGDFDAVVQKEFADVGVKSKQDILDIFDEAKELMVKHEALQKEVETMKAAPKGVEFKSDNQKKVYELLKDYDPDKIPDGLNMLAGLVSIDLTTADTKLILEQEYIMQHPEWAIDRSRARFNKKFDERFTIKDEESLTSAELKEKKEDIEDDLKTERSKAVKFIKEKQEEFKLKSAEDKKVEEPAISKEVESGIATTIKQYTKHVDGIDTLTWEVDEASKEKFHYKFSKEQVKSINSLVIDSFLKDPTSYNSKGELVGFDPEEKFQQAAHIVCGPDMVAQALKFAQIHAQIIKAEDIGKQKPSRKAKSSGDIQSMTIDAQMDRLAAKKKAERGGR